jgi:PPE-repeat protein
MLQHHSPASELGPVMDFGTLPPESNSGRMHSGPGAGSMMDAAKAWGVLGAQLADMALTYRAVIAELEPGGQSASTTSITQAVAPYLAWLDATAAQARQTASQATAAAAAYGLALAAVVAPHVIDANRLRRITLAAANCLGQLSPAVADADGDYERMWAQDAAAMYAYARASAGVWKLTPFDSPPPAAGPGEPVAVTPPSHNWTLTVAPEVITTGRQVISTISEALGALSTSPLATFDTSLLSATAPLSKLSSLSAPVDFALKHLSFLNKAAALCRAAVMCSPGGGTNHAAPRVSVGRGAAIGILSVPRAWTRSVPTPTSPSSPATPVDRSQ